MKASGDTGWIGLVIFVILYDKFGHETMSKAFWNMLESKHMRWFALGMWTALTAHLFKPWVKLPTRFDIFHYLERIGR